ncbi:hypothetical protein [Nonomuraea sp. NPDC001023]|uniref:hypothetical protein n=1 Tax=unclassified Nonomuraea TaxID=2593643 RepID=UPI003330770D
MRTIISVAAGLAVAGLAAVLPAGQAVADDTAPAASTSSTSSPSSPSSGAPADGTAENTVTPADLLIPDGFFYAAEHPNGLGKYCRWLLYDTSWADCLNGENQTISMENQASQMFNNGFPGGYSVVKLYWGRNYTGAWRCLASGNHWDNLSLGRETFNGGAGLSGYGQSLNDNVASHKWVDAC